MHQLFRLIWIIVNFSLASSGWASEKVLHVTYPSPQSELDNRNDYFLSLLKMSLDATVSTHGEYSLSVVEQDLPASIVPMLIRQNRIVNIMSSPVTEQLNTSMLSIPFPLLMGIQGIRISLLHQDNQHIFAGVESIDDVKKITFGHGLGWVDALIFQDAKLNIGTAVNYESLFGLLATKRIDAFTRGANEIYPELKRFSPLYPNMVIDKNILFYYPLPVYFYVAKDNTQLANRIMTGLKHLAQNGEFMWIFEKYYGDHMIQLELERRDIIQLDNNYVPIDTLREIRSYLHPTIKQHIMSSSKDNRLLEERK